MKIKRFFDCQVPVNLCNFKCDYCTVGQWKAFKEKYTLFHHPIEQMAKAMRPERMGGICAINLCGNGETLLHPQIIDFASLLLQDGHYVSIVTNGTVSKAIDSLCALDPECCARIFIKFSFHYTELLRLNLLDEYFDNINKSHKAGISFTVELVASDANVSYINEIKRVCMERLGVLCHLTDPRANTEPGIPHLTQMPLKEHIEIWSQFQSPLFDYRQATWGISRKQDFCYAGVWSFNLGLTTGNLKQCYRDADTIQFIFENIDEPIHFLPRGHFCSFPHCFNSHVFDCLCGVIPEVASPSYAALRNRVLPDGSEWLKPAYQEIYSHKVGDNNDLYLPKAQIFTDGILHLLHCEGEPPARFTTIMGDCLKPYKPGKLFIYGENRIAQWLLQNFDALQPYSEANIGDVIMVTDFSNFAQIKADLEKQTAAEIISVVDLAVTCNCKESE